MFLLGAVLANLFLKSNLISSTDQYGIPFNHFQLVGFGGVVK